MKKRSALAITLCCLLLTAPLPAPAADAESTAIERRLSEQQKRMERLQQGLTGQRARVQETRRKEESLLAEMESLEAKLRQERARLRSMQADLGRHEQLIAEKQAELEIARAAKEGSRFHVQQRLAAFYRLGPTGVFNILFARESLPDLLNFDEYFRRLIRHDQEAFSEYRARISQLAAAQDALEEGKKELVATIAGVKEQEQNLAETRARRAGLLNRVKTEKKLYQRALEEIEEASQQLNVTMEKLKREATERKKSAPPRDSPTAGKKAPPPAGSSFAAGKGRFDPPVSGTVTTQFGASSKGKFGITTVQNGIDIRTEPGAQVRAIHGGKVVYAGTLRGYGAIVIIDHGDHYFSLMSRLGELHKKEGDLVSRGEVVATMSDQEGLVGEGLHFEIRRGTTPENPLHWVNNAKLKITAGRR
ncbi:MAG: peptidoglycan DD-metalloendopeptidase family protein [Thermodesulfobacteriota bacterium]